MEDLTEYFENRVRFCHPEDRDYWQDAQNLYMRAKKRKRRKMIIQSVVELIVFAIIVAAFFVTLINLGK